MSLNLNEEVYITGQSITFPDYIRFNLYHQKRTLLFFFTGFLLIFILMNAIELLADLVILLLVGDYWGVILILLWITLKSAIPASLILLLMFGLIFLRIRKGYNSDRMIKSELSYTINKEGIKQKIRRSTTYYEWEDIFKVCEKRDIFLVFNSFPMF